MAPTNCVQYKNEAAYRSFILGGTPYEIWLPTIEAAAWGRTRSIAWHIAIMHHVRIIACIMRTFTWSAADADFEWLIMHNATTTWNFGAVGIPT